MVGTATLQRSVLWTALLTHCVLLLHCKSPNEPKSAEAAWAAPSPARPRPPAVVLDPASHVPEVQDTPAANPSLRAVAQPEPLFLALAVTERFFQAIVAEDTVALALLLTRDAEHTPTSGRHSARALDHWTRRLLLLEYQELSPGLIYSKASVTATPGAAADPAAAEPDQPLPLRPGEMLLRVPISSLAQGMGRFGPVIELALTQLTGDYKIRVIREDFDLPQAP